MTFRASHPNRRTVWSMFALGIMIGVGGAYVAIHPDALIELIDRGSSYVIPHCSVDMSTESVESITQSAQDIFQTTL